MGLCMGAVREPWPVPWIASSLCIQCLAQESHTAPSISWIGVTSWLRNNRRCCIHFSKAIHSYSDIFASSTNDIDQNALVRHQIDTGDAHPIQQRVWQIPLARRQEVTQLLQDVPQGHHPTLYQPKVSGTGNWYNKTKWFCCTSWEKFPDWNVLDFLIIVCQSNSCDFAQEPIWPFYGMFECNDGTLCTYSW